MVEYNAPMKKNKCVFNRIDRLTGYRISFENGMFFWFFLFYGNSANSKLAKILNKKGMIEK